MKCLIIASDSAEILFYWTDAGFEQHVQERYGTSFDEYQKPPAFEDSLYTLFAPIIISTITMMDRLGDTYSSFCTENKHVYALHQFEECLYIAVSGDGEESEDELKRKIFVMKKLTEVLFGMVTLSSPLLRRELRPQDTEQRWCVWKKLQSLLETFSRLCANDQSFLLEAVERLIHPTLCEQCIGFLERRVVQQINSSAERGGEEVLHAFILVHTKLLAFYSSRNASALTTSDLLTLIVMVQDLYPSNFDLGDSTPEEVESSSAPEIFYTPEPSPTDRDSGPRDGDSPPVFEFVDPDIHMAEDTLQTLAVLPPDPATPVRVFLEVTPKEGFCPMMPHSMYCLPLWPGISLILLTKIPNSQVAMSVYAYLEAFSKLEKKLGEASELGSVTLRGHTPIHDLRSKLDKFIRVLTTMDIQTSQLQSTWTEFKNRAFSRSGSGINRELVLWCRNMRTQLCAVYRQCFAQDCMSSGQRLSAGLQERALTMTQDKLMDWKDFLLVKSRRNITMVSYLDDFPGLVHFLYVDRAAGQMIAPSLSVTERNVTELGKGPLAHFIKNKVWGLVATARRYLQKGYTTITLRDGDYYCCYFLWFENETGFKLDVVDVPSLPDDSAPIGMLAVDYYRKLLRYFSKSHPGEVVKCYELLTMHLGVIPTEFILQNCSELAKKLWEPSRIPLL